MSMCAPAGAACGWPAAYLTGRLIPLYRDFTLPPFRLSQVKVHLHPQPHLRRAPKRF